LRGRGSWGAFSLPVLLTAQYYHFGKGFPGAVVHSRAFRLGGFAEMAKIFVLPEVQKLEK